MATSEPVAVESTPITLNSQRHLIQPGNQVLIRLPSAEIRTIRVEAAPGEKTINLGKYGSFRIKHLIGQPFGLTYEIQQDKSLTIVPPKMLEELEDTGATNELIVDANEFVQPLTSDEIEALKKAGVHASEIIKRQIETHVNYQLKTEYSKDKYKKRKQAKFAKEIAVLVPSIFNIASYLFEKDAARILYMRVDTLGQIANFANLRPGGRFIVIDGTGGLLIATCLERLGGQGRVLYLSETDTPPQFPMLELLNLPEDQLEIFQYMDWAAADEEHVPVRAPTEPEGGEYRSEGQKERYIKRKQALDAQEKLREELFSGEWDGLIIAAQYEPFSIVQRLSRYLAGSATITIYSPYLPVLTQVQSQMRPIPEYLNPSITESWLRQYQVLPGRTHPLMNMTGGGGYILHALRVYDDPKASSALTGFRKRIRLQRVARKKTEGDTGVEGVDVNSGSAMDEDMDSIDSDT